jgi:tetratricopeptide (TPR) repeat protein
MSQNRAFVAIAIASSLAAAGCCGKFKKGSESSEGPAGSVPALAASSDIDPESGMSHGHAKVDRGVKCFNRTMRIGESGSRYLGALRGGEPSKARVPYVLEAYDDGPKLCKEAKADPDPPNPEFDRTVGPFSESVDKMTPLLKEMAEYYKTKKYEVDKFAQGKTLHAQFKTEYDKFKKAQDDFEKALDLAADKVDDERIAKAKLKMDLRYHSLVFMRDAKFMIREATKKKPAEAEVARLRGALDTSYDAFSGWATSHPDQATKAFMFGTYKDRASDFIAAVRGARGNALRDDDVDRMLKAFNSMVDASNRVKWYGLM